MQIKDRKFVEEYCKYNRIKCKFYIGEDTSFGSSFKNSNFKDIDRLCKTVIFVDENNKSWAVVVLSKYKILQKKLAKLIGAKKLRLATHEEVVKYTGYFPGAVSPLSLGNMLIIDTEVTKLERAWFGGGDKNSLVELSIKDIIRIENPKVLEVPKKLL